MSRYVRFMMLSTVFVASCGGTMYTPPDSTKPYALVRFTTMDGARFSVTMYEDVLCAKGPNAGLLGVPGADMKTSSNIPSRAAPGQVQAYGNTESMLSPPNEPPINFIERKVPADRELAFMFFRVINVGSTGYQLSTNFCKMTIGFSPKGGEQYEARFGFLNGHCRVGILRLSPDDSASLANRVPDTTVRVINPGCDFI